MTQLILSGLHFPEFWPTWPGSSKYLWSLVTQFVCQQHICQEFTALYWI